MRTPILVALLTLSAGFAVTIVPGASACISSPDPIDCGPCLVTFHDFCVPLPCGVRACASEGTCSVVAVGPPQAVFFSGFAGTGCGVGGTAYLCEPTDVHHEPGWSCQPVATLP